MEEGDCIQVSSDDFGGVLLDVGRSLEGSLEIEAQDFVFHEARQLATANEIVPP